MIRLATYNVEWFDALFDDAGQLTPTSDWSARYGITKAQQIAALTQVFQALDADAVLIVEAPDTSRRRDGVYALEGFAAAAGLRATRAIQGFANDTQQEIILLFDPTKIRATHSPNASATAPAFDTSDRRDLDLDANPERIEWSKPPLELTLEIGGRTLCFIGVHAKSKAPHGARTQAQAQRLSIANRRKQLAQCLWLRARIDDLLAAGQEVIVAGDFNDGPGLDVFEKLFGRSSIEIVLGAETDPETATPQIPLFDPHAVRPARPGAAQVATARFFDRAQNRFFSALLDFIMVSPGLRPLARQWRIWHPFDDPACFADPALREALLTASDHFPVVLEIDIAPDPSQI